MAAVFTGFDMATKRGGATLLDRRHHLQLMQAEMPGVRGSVSWSGNAKDVGNLERGGHPSQPLGEVRDGRASLSSGLVMVRTVRVATLV